jgi:hypothetical protein
MKQKIVSLLLCILMIMTSLVVFKDISNVTAVTGSEEEENIGLDYDFIYEVIEELSLIIFNKDVAIDHDIWKGRNFGTEGERHANEKVKTWFLQNSDNLSADVYTERIGNESYGDENDMMRALNNKLEITGYGLEFREGTTGEPDVIIPNNESFPFKIWTNEEYENFSTDDYYKVMWYPWCYPGSVPQGKVKLSSNPLNITKYDVSETFFNQSESFVYGELTYITDYPNATMEDKADKIHLINVTDNDFNDTVEMLEDCNASGFMLIRDDFSTIQNWSINVSGMAVSEENGSMLIDLFENGTMFVSSSEEGFILDSGTIYIFHYGSSYPLCDKLVYLYNASEAEQQWGGFILRNNIATLNPLCAGFLIYDTNHSQSHFQYPSAGLYGSNLTRIKWSFSRLSLPTFSINGSVVVDGEMTDFGDWISRNNVYVNFWVNETKNHEVESYNVICDINGSDNDKWIVFSGGHHEAWWGQQTIDDAAGIGQMLGGP